MLPFDDSFFDRTAYFYATGETVSGTGGVTPSDPPNANFLPASLQPFQTTQSVRWDDRRIGPAMETRSVMKWNVFTQVDPYTAQGNTVVIGSKVLTAMGQAVDESYGDGLLWRTECEQTS